MKRLNFILPLLLLAIASGNAHTYTSQSVLSSGKWVKIRVAETGVHCLTYDELSAAGLNPANVRIYGYGGAALYQDFRLSHIDDLPPVAFYMNKGADGIFNAGDYILFYAQGVDRWDYTDEHFVHTRNPYSRYGYYFLSDDTGEQRLITTAEALTSFAYTADTYSAYRVHDVDSVNLVDVSGKAGGGREFYGEQLSTIRRSLNITIPLDNVVAGSSLDIRCRVAGVSREPSTFTMSVGSNSYQCVTEGILTSENYKRATTNSARDRFTLPANGTGNQVLKLSFANSVSGSRGYLNYLEMTATCRLTMVGKEMLITNVDHLGEGGNTQYTLAGATADIELWDISDPTAIKRIPATLSGSNLTFVGYNTARQTILAVKPGSASGWLKPKVLDAVPNQNLHALANIDMVIIAPEQFVPAARIIADAHERYDAITTAIVTDQQVYNEFSSGTPDATAYRWIMKMLYDRAANATQKPKSLLLLGDGSYDNRKLMPTSAPNILLTYQAMDSEDETQAYATDDYFAFLDDNEGEPTPDGLDTTGKMDIGVGRLPVRDEATAEGVARKIVAYLDNTNPGKWRQQIVFAADDGDHNMHTSAADHAAELLRLQNPAFVVNKVYIDAYPQEVSASGESSPQAKNRFANLLNEGVLFMNYSGHGGYNNISSENLLTMNECRSMTNTNHGFWMLATCGFAHFDATDQSASEEAVNNPIGGAIAVMSACRTVYAGGNELINMNLCSNLFKHSDDFTYNMTIGEACRLAKNLTSGMNKLPYVLLGDPAIRLHYPTDYRVRTEQASDTLNAITQHTFTGWIENAEGDTAREFNGVVNIAMMDKLQRITTLDNDEPDPSKKQTHTYNDYPNTLYKGIARVENGHFRYTFMVPKDIRYNFGNGRITYYALDSINGEGIGHNENFVIGGSAAVAVVDTLGPDVDIYLNTRSFRDGDKTTENPHFYADIYDDHGVNTAGSGIGHDLMLTIDDDPKLMYVLNDYYEPTGGYQSGSVSYRLNNLSEGKHSLTFRAWDMLNNSTTRTLTFDVTLGLEPTIYSVIAYPNPLRVNEAMQFRIDYDQPDELMEVHVYVYSPQGELVYHSMRKGTEQHSFAVSDAHLKPGVFLYRVALTTTEGVVTGKTGKLIVYEK